MLDTSFFEIFAECSIAFAGFGAVHAAFKGTLGARGVFRAWSVVTQGGLAFVLSVVPMLFALTSLADERAWRWASAIGCVGCLAMAYSLIVLDIRMTRQGHPPQAPLSIRIAQGSSILANLSMASNLVGWPWSPGPLLYAIALTCILTTGLVALLHSFLLPLQLALAGEDPGRGDEESDDS
jgi:hypothetical protein